MAGSSRRRKLIIGAIIVALSLGIVFASLPYLQPPPANHGSISAPRSVTVRAANSKGPGFNGLKLNITTVQSFYVGVSVSSGAAIFCVMSDQPYEAWAPTYNQTGTPSFPSGDCIYGPTQLAQGTLQFVPSAAGLWVVVALNYNSAPIGVAFLPA